jgi:hypothetical protein
VYIQALDFQYIERIFKASTTGSSPGRLLLTLISEASQSTPSTFCTILPTHDTSSKLPHIATLYACIAVTTVSAQPYKDVLTLKVRVHILSLFSCLSRNFSGELYKIWLLPLNILDFCSWMWLMTIIDYQDGSANLVADIESPWFLLMNVTHDDHWLSGWVC